MSRGKQQILIFSFGFILAAALLIAGYFIYTKLMNTGTIQSINLPKQTVEEKKTKVLISIQRIEKGDELKPEFFQLADRVKEEVPANSIIDANMLTGKRAAAVIDQNAVITDSMIISPQNLYKDDDRLKDYALAGYLVADTVKPGDWIDVEMVKSNGDTSIVLSKKQVMNLLANKAIVQVTTEERSMINHAIAEQTAGMGHIEALLYLDEKQPASKVTYVPAKIVTQGAAAATEPAKSTPATTQAQKETNPVTKQNDTTNNSTDTSVNTAGRTR